MTLAKIPKVTKICVTTDRFLRLWELHFLIK